MLHKKKIETRATSSKKECSGPSTLDDTEPPTKEANCLVQQIPKQCNSKNKRL